MQLSKAVEGYLFDKQVSYSPSTIESYKVVFKNLLDFLGDKSISAVTHDDLTRFIVYLQTDYIPHRFGSDTSKLKPASVDLHWKGLRSFFGWAAEVLEIPRPDLRLARPEYKRAHVVPFSEDDIRRMLKHVEYYLVTRNGKTHRQRIPTGQRDKTIILTLLDTGLRIGELLRIQIKDVNFEAGEILVTPFGTGKKTKPRLVVLGDTSRRALWLYVARLEQDHPTHPTDRLFPMSKIAVRLMLRRLSKRSGIPDIHPHRFRHSFAIWYLRGGGDIFTLQRLLGHSTMRRTSPIAHVNGTVGPQ